MTDNDHKFTKVPLPIISECVAEYIEHTKERNLLELIIEQEIRDITWNNSKVERGKKEGEINRFVLECSEEFLIARNYGYRVKENGNG